MTFLKVGDYYYIGNYKDTKKCVIVKIDDISQQYAKKQYAMVKIIRVPQGNNIFSHWNLYAMYGISIPVSLSNFEISKKLTKDKILAVIL